MCVEEMPDEFKQLISYEDDSIDLRMQQRMAMRVGVSVQDLACNCCGEKSIPYKKCGRCHSVRYCNELCQTIDWPNHRHSCFTPQAKVRRHIFVTLPEHECTRCYIRWHTANSQDVPIMLENKDAWIYNHGLQAYRRTSLSLAVHGRPAYVMAQAWCK